MEGSPTRTELGVLELCARYRRLLATVYVRICELLAAGQHPTNPLISVTLCQHRADFASCARSQLSASGLVLFLWTFRLSKRSVERNLGI